MNSALAESLGISSDVFHWIVVPSLIFLARLADVSINTVRVMLMSSGGKQLAPALGFFEAFIWLIAIGQIMQNVGSILSYIAYAGGFATGIWVGIRIEERLAIGKVIVRIITAKPAHQLIDELRKRNFGLTNVEGEGAYGKVNIIFTIVERKKLEQVIALIQNYNPNAFYTIENVRFVAKQI
ncbi:MAG: DUF2179 domain-containing protein [Cytophagales bacterium]|nr:DUF2179 domain-containing protein [Cytophagales bacterium]MDW8384419.1 DUF2179 domain-containing protein [Flammeovirgaceae bacterium]